MRFKDKVAIVTGGASGIGRAIALGFAREGANVVVADVNEVEGQKTAQGVQELGRKSAFVKTDVSRSADVRALAEQTLGKFGRVDILVNDAGISTNEPFLETTEERWDRTIAINLKGVFLCCQAVAREMVKQGGGKIINIASVGGTIYYSPISPQYHAAKAGVIQLTKVMAVQLAPHKINVNCIGPGSTKTPMTQSSWQTEEGYQRMIVRIPLGRMAEPEDMVGATIFFASDESNYVTGQTLFIEGGALAGR